QSAMFDKDTLIITYDEKRGEPRGARRRGADPAGKGLGDCIDCTLCVQVCPTGIDIRKGLQYECIACAACIDACDSVMDKMEYPRGLIRYSTEHSLHNETYRLLRPRTLIYSAILTVLVATLVSMIAFRDPVILDVIRDRNALYRDIGRDGIENSYTVRIVNKQNRAHSYRLSVAGMEGLSLHMDMVIDVAAESVKTVPVSVIAPHETAVGGKKIEFHLASIDDPSIKVVEESRFRGPNEGER
ncbi:MAG: cytochrome c oxidase accessory protein CcoG, partial [Halioglobus sp.]|nr:cytochrome c oxidase accessory protein CcoG [Halioglobus sp.]